MKITILLLGLLNAHVIHYHYHFNNTEKQNNRQLSKDSNSHFNEIPPQEPLDDNLIQQIKDFDRTTLKLTPEGQKVYDEIIKQESPDYPPGYCFDHVE